MAKLEDYRAKDLMTKDFITVHPDDNISEAVSLMKEHNIAEIPVLEDGGIVGLVSEDVFSKRRHISLSTKLRHLMNSPPEVDENDSAVEVCEMLMSSGYKGVPVTTKKGDCVGFISRSDIISILPEVDEIKNALVNDFMTPSPTTINEDSTIGKARANMDKLNENVLPVVDQHGRLSGMVGIKDIASVTSKPIPREARGERGGEADSPYEDIKIQSMMESNVVSTRPDEKIQDASQKMIDNSITSLVALDGDDIKGILTKYDLIEMVTSFHEAEQVYVQITGLEEDPEVYERLYDKIQRYLNKINKVVKPLVLNVHVVTHQEGGKQKKYSIRFRLSTDLGMFYIKNFDWNLMSAMDEGLDSLRKKVFGEKEKLREKNGKHQGKHPKYR